jgi:tetratricopeptide (TPR) repeat protein
MKLFFYSRISVLTFFLTLLVCAPSDKRKGTISLELGDYTMAIRFFSRVLDRHPDDFEARLGMGKALLQQSVDDKNDSTSWRKAIMHFEAARTVNARADVHRLISQVWSERAYGLLHGDDTLQALEALTEAISADPQSPEPLNLAGIIYFRTGNARKAKLLFERVLTIDTANASSLFNLGMVYWKEQQFARAHEFWLQALKCSPEDEDFLYWFALAEKRLRTEAPLSGSSEVGSR